MVVLTNVRPGGGKLPAVSGTETILGRLLQVLGSVPFSPKKALVKWLTLPQPTARATSLTFRVPPASNFAA